jgi:hypothetical protein
LENLGVQAKIEGVTVQIREANAAQGVFEQHGHPHLPLQKLFLDYSRKSERLVGPSHRLPHEGTAEDLK